MALKDLGRLRPESEVQREVEVIVTGFDVQELLARMEQFDTPGEASGEVVTSAAKTRALFFAESQSSGIVGEFEDWLNGLLK